MRHAARRGWCATLILDRPAPPPGRIRWLAPEEANRLIAACSDHFRPLVFLFWTGARIGEALWLDWREVDLIRRHVIFIDTKNGEIVASRPCTLVSLPSWRIFPIGTVRCFGCDMASPTPAFGGAAWGVSDGIRKALALADVPASRSSRPTIAATAGRLGTTRQTAISVRCRSLVAGKPLPW